MKVLVGRVVRCAARRAAEPAEPARPRGAPPEGAAPARLGRALRVARLACGAQRHPAAATVAARVGDDVRRDAVVLAQLLAALRAARGVGVFPPRARVLAGGAGGVHEEAHLFARSFFWFLFVTLPRLFTQLWLYCGKKCVNFRDAFPRASTRASRSPGIADDKINCG